MPEFPVQDISASKRPGIRPERIATPEELRALRAKTITPEPAIEAAIEEVLYPKKSERATGGEEPRSEQASGGVGAPSLLFPHKSVRPVAEEPELLEKLLRAEAGGDRNERTERKTEIATKPESVGKSGISAEVVEKKDAGAKPGTATSAAGDFSARPKPIVAPSNLTIGAEKKTTPANGAAVQVQEDVPVSAKLAADVRAAEMHVSGKKSEEEPVAKPTILDRLAAVMRPSSAPPEPEAAEVVASGPLKSSKMLADDDEIETPEIDLLELGSILDQHRIWAESGEKKERGPIFPA